MIASCKFLPFWIFLYRKKKLWLTQVKLFLLQQYVLQFLWLRGSHVSRALKVQAWDARTRTWAPRLRHFKQEFRLDGRTYNRLAENIEEAQFCQTRHDEAAVKIRCHLWQNQKAYAAWDIQEVASRCSRVQWLARWDCKSQRWRT